MLNFFNGDLKEVWKSINVYKNITANSTSSVFAQSAGAVEYTDCFSAEG